MSDWWIRGALGRATNGEHGKAGRPGAGRGCRVAVRVREGRAVALITAPRLLTGSKHSFIPATQVLGGVQATEEHLNPTPGLCSCF